jgi:hypothetical protein
LEGLFCERGLTPPWTLCPMTTDPVVAQEWLTSWMEVPGVEGLVIKGMRQRYLPGARGWFKVRRRETTEAIVDLVREDTVPLKPDSADVQAMMALEAGALADAVARLSLLPRCSWLLIASNIDCLVEAVGQETADRLAAVAEQAELAPRPHPNVRW